MSFVWLRHRVYSVHRADYFLQNCGASLILFQFSVDNKISHLSAQSTASNPAPLHVLAQGASWGSSLPGPPETPIPSFYWNTSCFHLCLMSTAHCLWSTQCSERLIFHPLRLLSKALQQEVGFTLTAWGVFLTVSVPRSIMLHCVWSASHFEMLSRHNAPEFKNET